MHSKKIYAVLGVSRSGTSAIARGLNVLGVDFGNKLLPGDSRNPKGFFEDGDILYHINRGLTRALSDANININQMSASELASNKLIAHYQQQAILLLKNRMHATQEWGFKDPRTLTILPFWHAVFAALAVNDHYVITVRNPLAVALSTQKFIGLDIELGLLVWLRYLILAIDGTMGKPRVVVSYEQMLQDPLQQLIRIHQHLHITAPFDEAAVNDYAYTFLDKKLSHHVVTDHDLRSHSALSMAPLCLTLYDLLLKLSTDACQFDSPAFIAAWQEIKAAFDLSLPVYEYIEVLLNRQKNFERSLRRIERSWPWKLIYPLRLLEASYRLSKRKIKEKKRLIKVYE